jgi:hypothetical protein
MQRTALEQRVAALVENVHAAQAARQSAERELSDLAQQTAGIENEFATAKRTLDDVTAAFTRSNRDTQQADRRFAELRQSEESTRRKFLEASEAAAQFKAAEEFTGRARSQAEDHLVHLREQIAALTAEVAVAEQRAAEERSAEERASRERAAAEHKAVELQRVLDRIVMERATYEEQISEQHRLRDEADQKIAAAQARFDAIAPKYAEVRTVRERAQAAVDRERTNEAQVVAEHSRALSELNAFNEELERTSLNARLSALIEAEEAAARELAEMEAKLNALRGEQERAASERVTLEASAPRIAPPEPPPAIQPAPAAVAEAAPPSNTMAGHLDAADADDDSDGSEIVTTTRVRPNLQLVTNSTLRARPDAPPTPAPAQQASGVAPVAPMRMSSVDARKSFSLFGWGKRAPMPVEPEPVDESISVADRIARDFGNLGNATPEPGTP